MKKVLLTLLIGAWSIGANAQSDVKVNFLGLIFGNYGLGYEQVLSDQMSAGATINYYSYKFSSGSDEGKYSGFNIAPEFRFYFAPDDDAEGLFAAPYLKYRSVKGEPYSYSDTTSSTGYSETWRKSSGMALGVGFGRKWVADAGFIFETYVGIGKYLFETVKWGTPEAEEYYSNDIEITGLSSIDFRLGLSIGWRF